MMDKQCGNCAMHIMQNVNGDIIESWVSNKDVNNTMEKIKKQEKELLPGEENLSELHKSKKFSKDLKQEAQAENKKAEEGKNRLEELLRFMK